MAVSDHVGESGLLGIVGNATGYTTPTATSSLPGIFDPGDNAVVLAADPVAVATQGSVNLYDHETSHALDQDLGFPSESSSFIQAWSMDARDFGAQYNSGYYTLVGDGGTQLTLQSAVGEYFAESNAVYNKGPDAKIYMMKNYPTTYQF